ncbi:MAG: glycosyltransferase family 4 protein [Spirochaetota bacterium]
MQIVISTIALAQGDATGNDIYYEYQTLKEEGFDVCLYAEQYDSFYASFIISPKKLNEIISFKENLLIYHHGIYWEQGGQIINNAGCKVIMKYHNITPADFFKEYNTVYYNDSFLGRKQTEQFAGNNKFNLFLADSEYNAGEIEDYRVPKEKIFVLPPFNKIHDFDSVKLNLKLLEKLQDGEINLLFVSRVLPHKGLHHIIEVLKQYINYYGDAIRLNIIGGIDTELNKYMNELEELICQNHLEEYVFFRGKVSFSELKTYYASSNVLLVMSEHEGFCLPIIEAQYNKLPVIALDRCAVKDTLGKEQLVFQDIDYKLFASAIHIIVKNNHIRNYLSDSGYKNYLIYNKINLSKKFLDIINEIF